MTRARGGLLLGMALLLPGVALLAHAGFVRAKGAVGVLLVERALTATLADAKPRPPWPWADMRPVARLSVPRLGVERPVLSNASGSALAFGLGRLPGTSAIAGHRDSWAAFLERLAPGDEVLLETPEGRASYRVVGMRVVRFDERAVAARPGDGRVELVTCYPFRGWLHSPWRYVVSLDALRDSP
jgi:sortase A